MTDTPWQPMSEAPTDGTHCILAVRSVVQGAYLSGEWCAAFINDACVDAECSAA